MKNKIGTLAAMALVMNAMGEPTPEIRPLPKYSKEDEERKLLEYYQRKGLTKFNIDGKEIWARNYKNALRKSKKL